MVLTGIILKDLHGEKCYIVRSDCGLDFVNYNEIIYIEK